MRRIGDGSIAGASAVATRMTARPDAGSRTITSSPAAAAPGIGSGLVNATAALSRMRSASRLGPAGSAPAADGATSARSGVTRGITRAIVAARS